MPGEVQPVFGEVAVVSNLVLHRVHFLHRRTNRITDSWVTHLKTWQVGREVNHFIIII